MKRLISILLTGIAALGLALQAVAQISLSLQPSPQVINVGGVTSMDLVVSGLGNLSPPSLGAFDLDLSYNSAVLSAVSSTFGNFLDLGILGSLQFSDLSTAGVIHLGEISFESSSDLNDAQPDTFTLATLGFTGLAAGISSIDFTFASLSDEQGQSLVGFLTTPGSIKVIRTGVPDAGSTASLLLLGIVGLAAFRRCPETFKRR
ncbi:MAG: VPDSG-CTERM sorting domain-containing protein [Verrucomicrobiales bacterium]|nr:VPDSG-CTERM sorting domain-containing protein [Verrucomicrobiales bacterium]